MTAAVVRETLAALHARNLGMVDYHRCWDRMRAFTETRSPQSHDECWVVQHPPVYTQGLGGRAEHVLNAGEVPIVATDRGGQVTYHGPGQLVVYLLLDLPRAGLTVRRLIHGIESGLVAFLAEHGVEGERRERAPGIYVNEAKIASVGLRVRRGCSYHGLALNVDMDLAPFQGIDPCGYPGLAVTQLRDLGVALGVEQAAGELLPALARELGYAGVSA